MCVDPPSEVVATEFRGVTDEGATRPMLLGCHGVDLESSETDWDAPSEYVVKLTRPSKGQDFRTRMACELICAMLGNALGLNVPEYGLVYVSKEFVKSVPDEKAKERLSRNLNGVVR